MTKHPKVLVMEHQWCNTYDVSDRLREMTAMGTQSRSHPGRPFGDPSGREPSDYWRSGSGSSPYSGPYGAIGTKSYSGDASPQSMPSSTTRGDLSSHGIGVAQAS